MKLRIVLIMSISLALSSLFPSAVSADGIIIPVPPNCEPIPLDSSRTPPFPPCPPPPTPFPIAQLDIRYHHVTVKINDQVAITHVDQVFYNPNDWAVEGDYVFP